MSILGRSGLVERHGTGYRLGKRLFELGTLVSEIKPAGLRDAALPYLEDLYEQTHETVNLAVLDGGEVLFVEKIHGHNPGRSPSRVGGRLPAHCVALGKAMLAFSPPNVVRDVVHAGLMPFTRHTITYPRMLAGALSRVREQGVAYDEQEAQLGLTCVAAPIFDGARRPIAAVSVSGPMHRFQPARYKDAVMLAADEISARVEAFADLEC